MFGIGAIKEHKILFYDAADDEIRRMEIAWDDRSNCVLIERSDGALTMACFGSLLHMCRLVLPSSQIPSAVVALGCEYDSWEQAMEQYFSCGRHCLSDLQDLLDRSGIEYGTAVVNGGEAALWLRSQLSDK